MIENITETWKRQRSAKVSYTM